DHLRRRVHGLPRRPRAVPPGGAERGRRMSTIRWLTTAHDIDAFPSPDLALREPNGLLAAGGDLRPERLLAAYRRGIFPWYEEGQPILWWCPHPRAVLFPEDLRVSRSLQRVVRR